MKKTRLFRGTRVVCIIIILFVALFIGVFLLKNFLFKSEPYTMNVTSGNSKELVMEDFYNSEEYIEQLKNEMSDISGMTKYDKYVLGLDLSENADSDMDGLTDKEELEVYGSDPAKPSTAGDLYTDGFKVAHDMALTEYYEYEKEYIFPSNYCSEIILNATTASDFYASVVDYSETNMFGLAEKNVMKVYRVFLYSDYITIDLSMIEEAKGLSSDKLAVYVQNYYEENAYMVDTSIDGSKITLKKQFDKNIPYLVYLVKEENELLSQMNSLLSRETEVLFGSENKKVQEEPSGVVFGIPLLCLFGNKLTVVYEDNGNEKAVSTVKNTLVSVANDIQEGVQITDASDTCVKRESRIKISGMIEFFKENLSMFEYTGDVTEEKWYNLFFIYYTYSDYLNYVEKEKTEEISPIIYAGDFDLYKDTLRFPNFSTPINNGVCAGITHLTSSLFNNKKLDKTSGKFVYKGITYDWDITKDVENETLMNPGLSDYKTPYFVYEHTSENGKLDKNLTPGEQDFVTMVTYFWLKGNNAFDANDYLKGPEGRDRDKDKLTMLYYDGEVIRNIKQEIDNGRIVDGYFLLNNESGHAINIFAYEETETYLREKPFQGYVFYVYDNNYPDVIGTLTAEIHTHTNGKEYLVYYLHIPGASYYASSYYVLGTKALFVAVDSEFNILNNKH